MLSENKQLNIKILKPSQTSTVEKKNFVKLVNAGGEVNSITLEKNVDNAEFLAFAYIENVLVGVAALKNPSDAYKNKVFSSANVENLVSKYNYEVGYIYVDPTYRGLGIFSKLATALLEKQKTKIYLTTHSNNLPIIQTYKKLGFKIQ